MSDITITLDQAATQTIVQRAEQNFGNFGPEPVFAPLWKFAITGTFSGTVRDGNVTLLPPNIIAVEHATLHHDLQLHFTADLNSLLPHICLPRVCIPFTDICSPEHCINWPTISFPLFIPPGDGEASFRIAPGFHQETTPEGTRLWVLDLTLARIDTVHLGLTTDALAVLLNAAVGAVLSGIPFIGPFLAFAINLIVDGLIAADLLGLLTRFVNQRLGGKTINLYRHSDLLELLSAQPPDPAVHVLLQNPTIAVVNQGGANKLVLGVDISR